MTDAPSAVTTASRTEDRRPRLLAAVEVTVAVAVVLLDVGLPSLILCVLAGLSLAVRHQGPSSLGIRRARRAHMLVGTAVVALVWSVFQLAVTLPLTNHLSGEKQDVGVFADVESNLGLLLLLLLLSWTLGAMVEEIAFRGFLLTRVREVLGNGRAALIAAVIVTSVLFGLLHSEQGVVGVVAVALDGVVFCALRLYFGTVWAPVLAHGFNNTLGLATFFVVGPVYGFW